MDDLKQRFLGFINKQGVYPKASPASPREESWRVADLEQKHSSGNQNKQGCSDFSGDRLADQDILEAIELEYFKSEGFDPCRHELKKLGEVICCDEIDRYLQKLRQQQLLVSKQVLQLILQKQNTFGEEFARVLEIQHKLQTTLHICREGRRELNLAKRQFTTASLGILANYRKRQLVQGLLHSLNTIKTLQRTEERLQELLSEGNYPGAISLLVECQGAAATYRHFTCVAALSGKLQDTLEMAEETLDQALARVCSHFDAEHYSRVQAAYRLLCKTQTAMDQLHMHFASAIHNAAFGVVQGYVELCVGDGATQKKQYKQLCESVTPESFIPCLIDLCKALWTVMKSYHQVIGWHQVNDVGKLSTAGVTEPVDFEATFNKQYVKQKLENGLARIWHDVQCRISMFLLGSDLTWYKFEEFLQVLAIVHRLMEIGEEFCGSKSEELQDSIKTQSSKYFATYHRERLDELRTFLENESWAPCPVKHDFSILQLQEFRTLRHALLHSSGSTHSQDGSSAAGGDYFMRYAETGSPFDISLDDTQEEDFLANFTDEPSGYFSDESDEDIPEELKKDFVDENAGEVLTTTKSWRTGPKKQSRRELLKAPILTNTSLNVLRHCGRYLQMSRLLRSIASTVIACMCQLFDYYLYAVHAFFTADLVTDLPMTTLYHLKLQASLERIRKELIMPNPSEVDVNNVEQNNDKVTAPHISPTVDLTQNENLHGLAERVVAVESLIFLAKQLESLESYMFHLQGDLPTTVLQQFFSQYWLVSWVNRIFEVAYDIGIMRANGIASPSTPPVPVNETNDNAITVSAATELRQPVYMCVSARAVDLRATLTFMSKVNWEIKDVMSQHSQYVDILLQELQIFSMRLEEVSSRSPIPQEVYAVLWENIFILACNAFVEGFSNAKRCTNGGRGLMQLDFTQFLSKLEKLTTVRPITGREFVEAYIKAFYLPEKQMEIWLREHKEYSSKQLLALVSCVFQNDKKARNRLIVLIEESGGR